MWVRHYNFRTDANIWLTGNRKCIKDPDSKETFKHSETQFPTRYSSPQKRYVVAENKYDLACVLVYILPVEVVGSGHRNNLEGNSTKESDNKTFCRTMGNERW